MVIIYSCLRKDPEKCSVSVSFFLISRELSMIEKVLCFTLFLSLIAFQCSKAVGRSILGLISGFCLFVAFLLIKSLSLVLIVIHEYK